MERFHLRGERYQSPPISRGDSSVSTMGRVLSVLLSICLLSVSGAAAAPAHPLSQITPIDTNLTMAGHSITGVHVLGGAMGALRVTDTLDLGSNELRAGTLTTGGMTITGDRITGFLQDGCPAGTAVADVHSNGSFTCLSTLTNSTGYLNSTGGRLSGPLNMTGHPITGIGSSMVRFGTDGQLMMQGQRITGLPAPVSSSDAMSYGLAQNTFLSRDGSDKMTGTLDMDGNDITNVDQITANTIDVPGHDNLTVRDSMRVNGTVWVRGADLAELYPADRSIAPGTIVSLGDDGLVQPAGSGDEAIGVVSTDPGHVMGRGQGDVPVALEGRVPVRVDGRFSPGDTVVPGHDGHGRPCDPPSTVPDWAHETYCDSQSIGIVKQQLNQTHAMVVLD